MQTGSTIQNKNKDSLIIETFFDKTFIVILGLILLVAANYLIVTSGGNGFHLPPNIAVWACLSVLILLSLYKILLTDTLIISPLLLPLLILCVLLIAPGLVNTQADTQEVILRIMQVVGFFLVFFTLSQYRLSSKQKTLFFYLIIIAALVQIIYVLAQKYHNLENTPEFLMLYLGVDKPPVGGFLQVNALSIFLVTSILISLYLVTCKTFIKDSLLAKLLLVLVMLGSGFVLAIISSRAALLALGISVPLMLFAAWNRFKQQKYWTNILLVTLFASLTLGFLLDTGVNRLKHKHMTSRLMAWSLSIEAIKEKPLLGHGLGEFAKAFFDQVERYSHQNPQQKLNGSLGLWTHPHNEILYWGVESGIIAMLGIIGISTYYLFLIFRQYPKRQVFLYLALLFPIGLSTMVSLPFYLSTLLMVVFVFILLVPLQKLDIQKVISIPRLAKKSLIIISGVLVVFYLWFLKEVNQGSIAITRYEYIENAPYALLQNNFNNPYWGKTAHNYAHQAVMADLLNKGNIKEARKHLHWFEEQLIHEEEPMYYDILLNSYRVFNEANNYEKLRQKAVLRYPARFDQYEPADIKKK